MNKNKLHIIKNTGFKVPKDYFASLEDSIISELKLKAFTTESGFKTPNNYFESLEDKIVNTVVTQHTEVKVIKLITWRKASYVAAVAASVVLIFNVFFNNTKNVTIDSIETASLENYFINEDIGSAEFASLFTKEDLSDVRLITDGYSSENLENFVFDNLDIEDIITK